MTRLVLLLAAIAALPGQAMAGPAARLADQLVGTYDNAGQEAGAPGEVGREARVGGIWIDRQQARFWRVDAPALGRDVIYLEWRTGGADGPLSRQRFWAFRDLPDGGVAMDFYTIRDPRPLAGRGGEAGAFRGITMADLIAYPAACAKRFRRADEAWLGRIRPEDCAITAQGRRRMTLDVTTTLDRRLLTYQETGALEDGRIAFQVPTWQPYAFRRVR